MLRAVPEGGLLDGTAELAQAGELGEITDTASEFVFGPGTTHGENGDGRGSGGCNNSSATDTAPLAAIELAASPSPPRIEPRLT